MTAAATTAWSLADHVATLSHAGLTAALDLTHPRRGLSVSAAGSAENLLGIDLGADDSGAAAAPVDSWLRDADLTAIYEPAGPRRLRTIAMWRPFPAVESAAWELVASAQTSLPASDAALAVVSDVTARDILCSATPTDAAGWQQLGDDPAACSEAKAVLLRRPAISGHESPSVLLAVHPADARTITISRHDDRVRVACWLFSAALEKGVLLRGRVLAAIGPAAGDLAWSSRLAGTFAASAAPLTT